MLDEPKVLAGHMRVIDHDDSAARWSRSTATFSVEIPPCANRKPGNDNAAQGQSDNPADRSR
jgi:hypothetical protein